MFLEYYLISPVCTNYTHFNVLASQFIKIFFVIVDVTFLFCICFSLAVYWFASYWLLTVWSSSTCPLLPTYLREKSLRAMHKRLSECGTSIWHQYTRDLWNCLYNSSEKQQILLLRTKAKMKLFLTKEEI